MTPKARDAVLKLPRYWATMSDSPANGREQFVRVVDIEAALKSALPSSAPPEMATTWREQRCTCRWDQNCPRHAAPANCQTCGMGDFELGPTRCRDRWHKDAGNPAASSETPAQALAEENARLREAIYWALGERESFGDEPPPIAGKWRRRFWWRSGLRTRAGLESPPASDAVGQPSNHTDRPRATEVLSAPTVTAPAARREVTEP